LLSLAWQRFRAPMRRDQGFTLIELLVVLAIMGLIIGVVVSHGPVHSRGLQTRAAAGALAQTFRSARAQAIDRAVTVTVAIDPEHHQFAADNGPIQTLAPGMAIAVLPPALKGPGDTGLIRFQPDGTTTGGEVLIGDGARRLRIDVDWLTGRVQVADAP
jgi:general secretion pathway protein H